MPTMRAQLAKGFSASLLHKKLEAIAWYIYTEVVIYGEEVER